MLGGGLSAIAMPRGSGKTSLCLAAAEWALLHGHRFFVVLIGASEDAACDLLEHVKGDFETNDLLLEDFPEVCYPIRRLGGITNRAKGQLLDGEQTRISWTAKQLTLPTVRGSCSSGAVVKVAGITGRIRGMAEQRPSDGATIRPDFVMIDDPQTDESAHSPQQVKRRLGTVTGAILGLAGPGKKIAGVMPVTVIAKGDMADQVLDRKRHPEWQGERIRLLRELPKNLKLWEQYADVRASGLREGRGLADATTFYREHQAALDDGAVASWPARFNPDEASAVQNAMNLKLADEESFWAEYQNEPMALDVETPLLLKVDQVAAKAIAMRRGVVPSWATKLTAFVDVQGSVLFYCVCAWGNDFTGHVVDYGCYPEQQRGYFFLREVSPTLADVKPGAAFEAQLYAGLAALTGGLLSREFVTDAVDGDGGPLAITRLIIDANWGESTSTVKQFCRETPHRGIVLPSHGRGITADQKPMSDYQDKPGERAGWNWRVVTAADRHILYDANSWKTFVAQRMVMSQGEPGNLSLFEGSPHQHKMFCEHVTAEYPIPVEGRGRVVNTWKARPNRENHWLDCLVGCAVAASEQGVLCTGHQKASGDGRRRRRAKASF